MPQKVKRCGTVADALLLCQPFFMLHAICFMLHRDITIAVVVVDDDDDEDEDCGAAGGAVGDYYDNDDGKTR